MGDDPTGEVELTFRVHAVPISSYKPDFPNPFPTVDADGEARGICDLLTPYGASAIELDTPPQLRDASWVKARLAAWAGANGPACSVLVWVGHGESDGDRAWLASYKTEQGIRGTGHGPDTLAAFINDEWASRRAAADAWVLVIVEACGADRYIDLLDAAVSSLPNAPRRVGLIAAGGEGTAFLGRFRAVLERVLRSYTDNDTEIRLPDLLTRLEDNLHPFGGVIHRRMGGSRPLRRHRDFTAGIIAPQDVYLELKKYVANLAPDVRAHFLPKAQGAEQGELAWYFVGRHKERRQIATWLREHDSGLLVVSGPAGAGKSALLGNLLVHTTPDLRELLVQAGQITRVSEDEQPPDGSFDVVITLTGLSTIDVVLRLVDVVELGPSPPDCGIAEQVERLLVGLRQRQSPFTVLLDALDEAQDPLATAASLIRHLVAVPACRVVLGTRRSTNEGPDLPDPTDSNIIDALGGPARLSTLTVGPDAQAVTAYVHRRLAAARAPHAETGDLEEASIQSVARYIGSKNRPFLYARLAVHEILAQPQLLKTPLQAFDDLFPEDHRSLFARAVIRLGATDPAFGPLLKALAYAQGRGLPRADAIWVTVANALTDTPNVSDPDIDHLLEAAAPYIMLDAEDGQSVYRLAHRTFQEFFLKWPAPQPPGSRDDRSHSWTASRDSPISDDDAHVTTALLLLAQTQTDQLDPYLCNHLSGHIARTRAWAALDAVPDVLDQLDLTALTADVITHAFGRTPLPPNVAATVVNSHLIADSNAKARRNQRLIGEAQLNGWSQGSDSSIAEASSTGVVWARRFRRDPLSIVLVGHAGGVLSLAGVHLGGGRELLASGGVDGTVRLWDAAKGRPVGSPLTGHTGAVRVLSEVHLGDGQVVLASGGDDGSVRLWDPAAGCQLGGPLRAHEGIVNAVAGVNLGDGQVVLASAGDDYVVRLWDPVTGSPVGVLPHPRPSWWRTNLARMFPIRAPSSGGVLSLAAVRLSDERVVLASGSSDGGVRLWDLASGGQTAVHLAGHKASVVAVVGGALGDGTAALASGDKEGTVRLWDLGTGNELHRVRQLQNSPDGRPSDIHPYSIWHYGQVVAMEHVRLVEGRPGLAIVGGNGSVTVEDLESGTSVGELPGDGRLLAVAELPLGGGLVMLASGGEDGKVRLWDLAAGSPMVGLDVGHWRPLRAVAQVPIGDGRVLLASAGDDATILLWDLTTGSPMGDPLVGHTGTVRAVALMPIGDGRILLASAGDDETIRLWDVTTGSAVGLLDGRPRWLRRLMSLVGFRTPPPAHNFGVTALAGVDGGDGRMLLVSGGFDTAIRLWDVATGARVGAPMSGHSGGVWAVVGWRHTSGQVLVASGGGDGLVRVRDAATGRPVGGPFRGHSGAVRALAVVRLGDGRVLLASGGDDCKLLIRDVQTEVATTIHLGGSVQSVAAVRGSLVVATTHGLDSLDVASLVGEQ